MGKDEILKKFYTKIYNCSFQKDLSLQIITAQKEKLGNSYKELFETQQLDKPIYINNEVFYLWVDMEIVGYGKKNVSINNLWQATLYYHNKLYQWLLVVAFEGYEEYLKEISRFLIKYKIPNSASKILNKIRNKLPIYQSVEGIDNRFLLALIEKMRHYIVHCNGCVNSRVLFAKGILESIGAYRNGNYDSKYRNKIDYYFNDNFKNEIVLLDIPVLELPGIQAKTTVLNNLFSVLLNSAYYINEEI